MFDSRVQLLGCTRLHSRSVCPEGRRPLWGGNSSPQEQQAFSPCSKLSFLTRHRRDNSRKVSRTSRCDEVKNWRCGDMSLEELWAKIIKLYGITLQRRTHSRHIRGHRGLFYIETSEDKFFLK